MLIYWIQFVVQALGALVNRYDIGGRGRVAFFTLAGLPCAAMIGLRWGIGPDFLPYWDIFKYSKLFTLDQSLLHGDPGYYTLMWLLHVADADFPLLNVICAVVFTYGLSKFSLRQPNPWLAFLVALPYLVIVVGMSGNRQTLALGFLLLALNAFAQEKITRFVVLVLIGALFHASVVLMAPICLTAYTKNILQVAVLLMIAAILAKLTTNDAFSHYLVRYTTHNLQSGGVGFRLAMNALAAVLFLWRGNAYGMREHEGKLWRNISWCSLALIPLAALVPSTTAVDRFLVYLFPLQSVVYSRVPIAFSSSRNAAGQLTLAVISYAAVVQFTFLFFGNFASGYVPYESIFTTTFSHRVTPLH